MSTFARAAGAIELTPNPPSMTPTLNVVRGEDGRSVSARTATVLARAWTGLAVPKSFQLCPPEPSITISKRRLPSASAVMWPVEAPSRTMKDAISEANGEKRQR